MKKLLLLVLLVSCSALSARSLPLDTVDKVDLDRYLGKWYEIARFDQKFQKNCTAVTATYTMRKRGGINVENRCRLGTPEGELKVAKARGWVKDKETNAKLKVQFFLRGLRLPFFAGNYWILELGEDYEYAVVGDPSRKYLWILSRTKEMDEKIYDELVAKAKDMHFDVSKLLKTKH
jgi:apolipoprotein D and lipocalin family protein